MQEESKIIPKDSYIVINGTARKLVVSIDLNEADKYFLAYIWGKPTTVGHSRIDSAAVMRDKIVQVTKEDNPEYFL